MTERARRRIRLGVLLAAFLAIALPAVLLLPGSSSQQSGQTRYVNNADSSCGGHSPCYTTIQAAVNAAQAGDTILIHAGTYAEQVLISGKNDTATATEASRILIEADPGAPLGSVVLQGTVAGCTNGHAVRFQQSKFITLRGLTITGAGGQAVSLMGGNNQNEAIHLERLRIFGNGSTSCDGGITIAQGNPGTLILNSLIYANGRNGVATIDAAGGPHSLIGNTVHANGWSGIRVARDHEAWLVNNAVTGNGTQAGSTGGRFGVSREDSTGPHPETIHLLSNLLCGNRLGEINGPALDATDSGNLTPTGTEGPGVTASPGCDLPGAVYASVSGLDGLPNTADDDFALTSNSPAIDRGMDPRTLGLDSAFNPLLEADFPGEGVRPKDGNGSGTAEFDLGAFEFKLDVTAPQVTFTQPLAGAFVRQTVTVEAQATDAGTGVQTFTLTADSQSLTATLSPTPPAASVTATAAWNTTTFLDGPRTLTASATDVAGNPASATRTVIVDNTPPDTQITGGPAGEINTTDATFTFTGTDNLTPVPNLLFAWSLDGGAFTAFSSATSARFTGLPEGLHTFQVKARDQAGNEDPTPATQAFTVALGPAITNIDPASGSVGTYLTITGARFEPGATQVTINGVAAVIRTITAVSITTTVPIGATSGNLTVTTTRGTASRVFTVTTTGGFALTVDPATVPAVQGTSVDLRVSAPATGDFTGLVTLTTGPLPSGVVASFSSPTLAPNRTAILTLSTTGTTPLGASAITVNGTASVDGRSITRSASTTLDVQAPGQTTLAGQVRDENNFPLAGVRISLGGATIAPLGMTDQGGNFLLPLSVTGPQIVLIDGSALNTGTAFYPTVPVTVDIQPGVVNTPGYLPKLRAIPAAKLTPIPPGQETVLTDPEIPGFTMTIPAGVQIIGWDGQPNTQVGVTVIPMDRSPLPPPPPSVTARFHYLFNFGKVGGGTPTGPVVIDPPNDVGALPGDQVELWYFNEAPDGTAPNVWQMYGTGTVSEDGTKILTDVNPATGQRYGIPRFCCGGMMINPPPSVVAGGGPSGGPGDAGQKVSEPVDAATGFFYEEKMDLVLPARIPLVVRRTYRTGLTNQGPFGLGTSWPYDIFLQPPPNGSTQSLMLFTPGNRQDLFARQADGTFVNTTSPALRGALVTTSPSGRTLRFKDGRLWQFDLNGRFISESDRNGNTVTISRDGQGRVTALTAPDGRQLLMSYTGANLRMDSLTDPLFRTVRYAYDSQGRLETVTDTAGGVTRYTYDANHRILTITDPRGITFLTNEYDQNGRVIRQTQADGGVWTFAYQLQGRAVAATTVTDPRGNATIYRFNPAGYLVSQTDALGQTTTFQREPGTNLLLSTTDPLGRITRFAYDAQGNVASITDPAGNVRTFTYEPTFNRVTSITDPLGNVTRFEYDAAGNLTAIVDPLAARTAVTYNASGEPTSSTDPLGNTTTFAYDAQGNLTTITDPLGNTTQRTYDAVSRLTAQTDPRAYATRFAYDPLNRLTQITDALLGLTRLAYDPNGNLLTVTDARGNSTSHTYDSMNRPASRIDPAGAPEVFEYDGVGNLRRHIDRKGQVATFNYDALNRRTEAAYFDGSTARVNYDAGGRALAASDSAGTIINTYDSLDRVVAQSTDLGTVSYHYDALGRRTRMDVPGQASAFYTYDTVSRLRTITQAPLNPVTINYDALGRRTLLTLPNGVFAEYQYDAASRLTGLTYTQGATVLGTLTYTYDAASNRTQIGGTWGRTGLPQPVASAMYDVANRQVAFGAQSLTYDLEGNLINDGATTYTWDARNRLVSLTGPGMTSTFQYDPLGRRTRKAIDGSLTDFVYDGPNPIQELSGTTGFANILASLGIDEYFTRTETTGTSVLLTDALGSTVALTDPAGTVRTQYAYEPFGATTTAGLASSNAFQFTGREHDSTGLYYYRARYFHPGLQRFIGEDPIGLEGGDFNLYAYVRNSPVNWVDPLGLRVINRSGHTVFIKPEEPGQPTIALGPGQTYPGKQDGIAVPCLYPGLVYKTVNNVDVMATAGGYVVHFGGSLKERGGQLIDGGWRGRKWQDLLHENKDFGWDDLFRKSRKGCGSVG